MAKQVTVLCDLDGSPDALTHKIVVDDTTIMIDLSEASYAKLQKALAPFVKAGTVTVKSNGHSAESETQYIREWLIESGYTVSPKGRIPQHLMDIYHAAAEAEAAAAEDQPQS